MLRLEEIIRNSSSRRTLLRHGPCSTAPTPDPTRTVLDNAVMGRCIKTTPVPRLKPQLKIFMPEFRSRSTPQLKPRIKIATPKFLSMIYIATPDFLSKIDSLANPKIVSLANPRYRYNSSFLQPTRLCKPSCNIGFSSSSTQAVDEPPGFNFGFPLLRMLSQYQNSQKITTTTFLYHHC